MRTGFDSFKFKENKGAAGRLKILTRQANGVRVPAGSGSPKGTGKDYFANKTFRINQSKGPESPGRKESWGFSHSNQVDKDTSTSQQLDERHFLRKKGALIDSKKAGSGLSQR